MPSSTDSTYSENMGHDFVEAAMSGKIDQMSDILMATDQQRQLLNFRNKQKETPLLCAMQENKVGAVNFLLQKGVNVNACCQEGKTALMYAAENQNCDAVHSLLTMKADPDCQDIEGWTALMFACSCSDIDSGLELVKHLLSHQANMSLFNCSERRTALSMAVESSPAIAELLLEPSDDWSLPSQDALSVCDRLVARNPLHYAIVHGKTQLAETLVKAKADLHATASVTMKNFYTTRMFSEDAMIDKVSALMYSAHLHDAECVARLLEAKMNPNAQIPQKYTPLMFAAARGEKESVQALLKYEADVNMQTNKGMTALMFAASVTIKDCPNSENRDSCVLEMCEHRADLEMTDNEGLTALDWARKNGSEGEAIAKILQYEKYTRVGENFSSAFRRKQAECSDCCANNFGLCGSTRCCGTKDRKKANGRHGPTGVCREDCDVCVLQ